MKISKLMFELQTILATHGDLDVLDPNGYHISSPVVNEATEGEKQEWGITEENFVYAQIPTYF